MRYGKVRTEHVYPPIPIRTSDWAAYVDPEGKVGTGATEAGAVWDYVRNLDVGEGCVHAGCNGVLEVDRNEIIRCGSCGRRPEEIMDKECRWCEHYDNGDCLNRYSPRFQTLADWTCDVWVASS